MNSEKRWAVIVAMMISACAALLAGEALLRYVFPQNLGVWSQTRDGLITLRPSFSTYLPGFRTHVRTNRLGFRDVEHTFERAGGTYRILLLGDSFMEALQVEFHESFPQLLQNELTRSLPCRIEVINAGVSGWGTDDQVAFLSRTGLALKPHLVLVAFTLHNDVSDNLRLRHHARDGQTLRAKPVIEAPLFRHLSLEVRSYLVSHSHLYQLAYQTWKSRGAAGAGRQLTSHVLELMAPNAGKAASTGWFTTKQLLAEAARLSKQAEAQLVVFPIPLIYQIDDDARRELLESRKLAEEQLDPGQPRATLFGILEELGISRVDLLTDFLTHVKKANSMPLYIRGDGHWSKRGHEVAASAIGKELTTLIQNSDDLESTCSQDRT